jgi:predicted NAD-dependent protein-ADP-ribosyltransferase YbiA (DUF1768 family)
LDYNKTQEMETDTQTKRNAQCIILIIQAVMGDPESYYSIANASNPRSAKAKGREIYPWDEELWQAIVCHVSAAAT